METCGSDDSREIVVQASIFVTDAAESGDDLEEEIPAVMFSCQYCEKYFKTMEAYEIHSQMHVDRNLSKCDYCENWYHTEAQLEILLRDHLDMKPFFCRVCGDRFTNEHSLEHHLQLHGGIKLFRCIFCFEMFSVLELLNTHLVLHAPPSVYKFPGGVADTVRVAEPPRECQKIPPVLPVVVEEQPPTSPDIATKRLMAKLPKLAPKNPRKSSKTPTAKTPPKSPTKDPPEERLDSPTTSRKPTQPAQRCQCKTCGVSFASGRKLRVHMRQRRRNKSVCRPKR